MKPAPRYRLLHGRGRTVLRLGLLAVSRRALRARRPILASGLLVLAWVLRPR